MTNKDSGKKNTQIIPLYFTLSVIAILGLTGILCFTQSGFWKNLRIRHMSQILTDNKYIIHACGKVSGDDGQKYTYTNSIEALKRMYRKGNRVVEVDFAFTTDDEIACVHEWSQSCYTNTADKKNASLEGRPLSLNEFRSVRINGYFTPMLLEDVLSFMKKHDDLILITDIKESRNEDGSSGDELKRLCARIMDTAPELKDRIIIQIYSEDEYDMVRETGFDYIIYTLYNLPAEQKLDTDRHLEFAQSHPLVAITFQRILLMDEKFMSSMEKSEIPLLVHTVDGKKYKKAVLSGGTISAIYTNDVKNG